MLHLPAAPLGAPIAALYSSPLMGGKVMCACNVMCWASRRRTTITTTGKLRGAFGLYPHVMCQVMCGGSFPSDYIHIYDTDSARDSLLLEGGRASLKPLLPVGRCGQGGAHMQVKAMLAADCSTLNPKP
jgi:hypothetical protein